MITLLFSGRSASIMKAVQKANEILASDTFYEKIALLPQMSNTSLTSPEIARILKTTNRKITIHTYWNPFGKTTKKMNAYQFEVNTNKISCVTAYAVNTLINETIQVIALLGDQINFSNSDHYHEEEENAFPWRIGEIAEIISRKTRQFA
ncbi:hypothetical protein [Flavobacterium soli]|uniref:hypothetical protein n=1 Tax=Flavobacterium soli TaxID=344881 RepID=UPI00040AB0E7|nr:hypothetical protein [Flavobacterium soli]